MTKNGWRLSKVAITGSTRSLLAKNGRKWVLANQIRPTTLSAAIVCRYTRFWPKKHRELPFLAVALCKIARNRAIRPCHPNDSIYATRIVPSKGWSMILLADRTSTMPSNILRGCESGAWSVAQKNIRETSTKLQRQHKNIK